MRSYKTYLDGQLVTMNRTPSGYIRLEAFGSDLPPYLYYEEGEFRGNRIQAPMDQDQFEDTCVRWIASRKGPFFPASRGSVTVDRTIPNLVVALAIRYGSLSAALKAFEDEDELNSESPSFGEAYRVLLMLKDGSLFHGDGLRVVRNHLGDLTQRAISDLLRVHLNTYVQWESGARSIPAVGKTAVLWLYAGSLAAADTLV
ncbi:hypothetical protein D3C87_764790 [compost metagenome]